MCKVVMAKIINRLPNKVTQYVFSVYRGHLYTVSVQTVEKKCLLSRLMCQEDKNLLATNKTALTICTCSYNVS
jgi:hypothetical protein